MSLVGLQGLVGMLGLGLMICSVEVECAHHEIGWSAWPAWARVDDLPGLELNAPIMQQGGTHGLLQLGSTIRWGWC